MSHLNQPQFKTPENARQYLEKTRWPHGPVCPHCGVVSKDHYKLQGEAHRAGLWKCKDCREQFSVTVGTVFERSKIALNVWLQAVYLLCSSKKGMSSHQLHRVLGVTYKTAWFMTHRIREAMTTLKPGPIGGEGKTVEVDETYWGRREGVKTAFGTEHKHKIVALVERGGKARSFHVANVTGKNLRSIVRGHVDSRTVINTDEHGGYAKLGKYFPLHATVKHTAKEYVRGDVTTNTVEGYFSILKRGLIGTYHHVSEAHLQRYISEFDFRYNNRQSLGVNDDMRANEVLREIAGKRLTYNAADKSA